MTESRGSSVLLSGLAEAGKSTWLAALWQVFEEDGFDSALTLEAYLGEQSYIAELNRVWTRCERVDRTPLQSPGAVAVQLRDRAGAQVRLEVPDLSGELFREHWAQRHWEPAFDRQVQAANGLLLMISTLTEGVLMLRDIEEVSKSGQDDADAHKDMPSGEVAEIPEWDPRQTPPQVQLVEHLQFVALRRSQRPLPVAVVFSAWDQIQAAPYEIEPREWLRREQPLLDQFLAANEDLFPSAIYGVSAQGGDLEKDRERMLAMEPIERLEVVEEGQSSHDLTVPLAWLVESSIG